MQSSRHYLRSYFEKYRKVQKIRHDIHITQLKITQYLHIFTCVFKRTNACMKAEARPPPSRFPSSLSAVGPHPSDASHLHTCAYMPGQELRGGDLTWESLYCMHPPINWVSPQHFPSLQSLTPHLPHLPMSAKESRVLPHPVPTGSSVLTLGCSKLKSW